MFGHTEALSDIDWVAEETEWNADGYVPLYEDYSYIVWTYDNHFVALRIKEVYRTHVIFDWAYQLVQGNPELKINQIKPMNRMQRDIIKITGRR